MTTYKNALKLLERSSTLALSIVDEQGYPKIYPMEKVLSLDLNKVIFITKKNSNKVRSLRKNNKCCVEVHTEDDTICLSGKIEIEENEKQIKKILPTEYIARLNNSGIHKYCVLIFNGDHVHSYINGELKNI